MSLLPADQLAGATVNDKIAHFLCYGLFVLLAAGLKLAPRPFLLTWAGIVLFGLLLEGAQSWVPGRESSLLDALANTAGAGLALVLVTLLSRRQSEQQRM